MSALFLSSRVFDALAAVWLAAVLFAAEGQANAAELLMFEQAGCPFCEAFDAEIARGYPASNAGRAAPLRRVDIHDDRRGGIDTLVPAVFTPTFVLVDDEGREIGRLEGYPGREWFYPEIDALIDRLPAGEPAAETAPE
ncbi:thioredoxin family protein [Aurantimonas sp. DM33-3]|uniref:thioredoxin family protein n=1 Tax=Aurantimonas sp. DM33-3 TaxID=2766955 RepID=UPI0016525E05|nr:thioredoxin family protein [Aurantimonas sp. DM33-3]MBC6715778.1 thioredoxin family protein [Aurantimonas sp. DM33-3]